MSTPADRLTAADLSDHIDRAEKAFADGDDLFEVVRDGRLRLESTLDHRIKRLVGVFVHMRDPHYSEAMALVDELKLARISRSVDLPEVFAELRLVISTWDASRQARRRAA